MIATTYLHAGRSHYTLRYDTDPTTKRRRAIWLIEEQEGYQGQPRVTFYATPARAAARLTAARRYDLHPCGESVCAHASPQAKDVKDAKETTPTNTRASRPNIEAWSDGSQEKEEPTLTQAEREADLLF